MTFSNKHEHLQRAKALLATEHTKDLVYAALELRLCLEIMTYEKLRSFEKHLPKSFLQRTWQPPQLLDAMKQFDPSADASFELYVGLENVPGQAADPSAMKSVGKHHAFGLAWLRKKYNSLGSHLHVRRTNAKMDPHKLRTDLANIAQEIEDAQSCSIIGAMVAEIIRFQCQSCNEQVTVSEHYAKTEKKAICQNANCEAEYVANEEGSKIGFVLRTTAALCGHCGAKFFVEERHLEPGLRVACFTCKGMHIFISRWAYSDI